MSDKWFIIDYSFSLCMNTWLQKTSSFYSLLFLLKEHAHCKLLLSWVTEAFHKKGFPIYHSKIFWIKKKKKCEDNDPSGVWVHMFKVTVQYKPTENWPPKWLIKGFCKTWTEQHGLWLGKEFRVVIENIYLATAKHPNTC